VACTFWLVECLAGLGRLEDAAAAFERAAATANDLGLFSEEYDPRRQQMLGNFPQALTHLSHIAAATELSRHTGAASGSASTTALAKPCGRGRRPERVNGSWRRLHVSFAVPRRCRHPSSPACDTLPRLTHRCGAPTHNAEAGSSQRI
jgi:hypothetical protein